MIFSDDWCSLEDITYLENSKITFQSLGHLFRLDYLNAGWFVCSICSLNGVAIKHDGPGLYVCQCALRGSNGWFQRVLHSCTLLSIAVTSGVTWIGHHSLCAFFVVSLRGNIWQENGTLRSTILCQDYLFDGMTLLFNRQSVKSLSFAMQQSIRFIPAAKRGLFLLQVVYGELLLPPMPCLVSCILQTCLQEPFRFDILCINVPDHCLLGLRLQ